MDIRLARDEESLEILNLFTVNRDRMNEADWTNVYPYWAIAIDDGVVIAALQMCMSRPIGRVENLLVKKDINKITATKAAHRLIKFAEAAMKANGCSSIAGYVIFKNKPIKNLIKKHYGAVVVGSGSMLSWRIS
jgi:hypothetical protein